MTKPKSKDWEEEFRKLNVNDLHLVIEHGQKKQYVRSKKIEKFIRSLLSQTRKEAKKEVVEKIEQIFDQFRSSNQKVKGKRRFGIPNFQVDARDLHRQILQFLKK